MESELRHIGREVATFIGLLVIGLLVVGAIGLGVYALLDQLTDDGRHLLATALIFALPIAYLLGRREAKAHRVGLERGIDLKLGARERLQQSAQTVKPTNDDILPRVGTMQIIDAPNGRGEIVD